MKKCKQCGYELRQHSSKYYCCNKEELFCSMCHSKKCPKCFQYRSTLLRPPQCAKCYSRVSQETAFQEKTCGKYFCSRCLVKSFKPAYEQSLKMDQFYSNNKKNVVKLLCGHQCDFKVLQTYLKNNCIECGKQYSKTIDYELKDGTKLCCYCHNLFKAKYKRVIISCLSCGRQIDNLLKAGLADSEGLILCQECVRQSEIQEAHLQKSRKVKIQETAYKEKQFQKQQKKQQIQVKKESQSPIKKQVEQKKQQVIPQPQQQKQQQNPQGQPEKQESQIPIKKDQSSSIQQKKKARIPQLQLKQKYVFENLKEQEMDVVNKIIDEMQEGDEEMRRLLGLEKKPLLKKHLSDQTKVQGLKLQIQQNKKSQFVTCEQCKSKVSFKSAYDVSKVTQTRLKSFKLSSISTVESLRCDKQQVSYVCRVCFFKSYKSKKISEIKDFPSTNNFFDERSRLTDSRSSNRNHLDESSKMRMSRSFMNPSPYKDFGLTSGQRQELKTTKRNESMKKDLKKPEDFSAFKQGSHRLQPSQNLNEVYQNGGLRRKCNICGTTSKKLVMSSNNNFYCTDCLSISRSITESRASKIVY